MYTFYELVYNNILRLFLAFILCSLFCHINIMNYNINVFGTYMRAKVDNCLISS